MAQIIFIIMPLQCTCSGRGKDLSSGRSGRRAAESRVTRYDETEYQRRQDGPGHSGRG